MLFDLLCWHVKPERGMSIQLDLPGAARCIPDAMFSDEKIAVFYDGCYWHECPEHHPRARGGGILAKDRRITARLVDLGWRVLRMWEHEEYGQAVETIVSAVKQRQAELEATRAEHAAGHDPNAWCERCEQWPHRPWPIGITGYCLRCMVHADDHADDHADEYGPAFAPIERKSCG